MTFERAFWGVGHVGRTISGGTPGWATTISE
jgi:hypothetical protein